MMTAEGNSIRDNHVDTTPGQTKRRTSATAPDRLAPPAELGIDLEVDIAELLDMTKTVAHEVVRPAAPLTSFLVGYGAARAGGGPAAVTEAGRRAAAPAERWASERPDRTEAA